MRTLDIASWTDRRRPPFRRHCLIIARVVRLSLDRVSRSHDVTGSSHLADACIIRRRGQRAGSRLATRDYVRRLRLLFAISAPEAQMCSQTVGIQKLISTLGTTIQVTCLQAGTKPALLSHIHPYKSVPNCIKKTKSVCSKCRCTNTLIKQNTVSKKLHPFCFCNNRVEVNLFLYFLAQ